MLFIGYKQSCIDIYIDNKSAINIASNLRDDKRTRHIDVRYHVVKKLVFDKVIRLKHIAGSDNPADILTKAQTNQLFLYMRKLILRY